MTTAQAVPTRSVWLVTAGAMAMATVIYVIVLNTYLSTGEPPVAAADRPLPRALFWSAAVAFLLASMLWTQLRVRGPIDAATSMQPPAPLFEPAEFQVRSIVALALAEVACILGFVQSMMYRAPLREYLPFGAATLLVIVLDIIPAGLRYWSSREA